jgi:hypothetical protein
VQLAHEQSKVKPDLDSDRCSSSMLFDFAPTIDEKGFKRFELSEAYYIEYDEVLLELCVCVLASQVLCDLRCFFVVLLSPFEI